MLDIQDIRLRKDELQQACTLKNKQINIDDIIKLDDERKSLQYEIDQLKHQQKQAWDDRNIQLASQLKTTIQQKTQQAESVKQTLEEKLLQLPNFIHPDVPKGKDESENVVSSEYGQIPQFDFEIKDHQTLGENLSMLDKEKATQVTWSRFYYLKGDLAQLQFAIMQYTFDILTNQQTLQKIIDQNKLKVSSKPFIITIPPIIINQDTANKMGRLHPKDDRYCIEEDSFMFIGSAEHSLWPIHMNDMLDEPQLPLRYVAYTVCLRREAWTYGKDTRWIFRNHQFDKIEMETFSTKEQGLEEQNFIIAIQQYLVQQLEIPYQLIAICTGDMWSNDYRQFDINCYMSGQAQYRETHTSDYMTDYQARRLNIKVQRENGEREYVHMNDATAFAFPRILIAIMENNQQADGTIKIPQVLIPHMGGKQYIGK